MSTVLATLGVLCGVFSLLIIFSFFNEKVLKLPSEIGLMTTAFTASLIIILLELLNITQIIKLTNSFNRIDLHEIIMNGFLCYLLFSGSARIKFKELTYDKFLILSLTFFSTIFAAFIYAGLTFVLSSFVGVNLSFIEACILGSIIAPTDPISAMSILKKAGLSERVSIIMEGESLFNDGIAVALFATFVAINNGAGVNPTYEFAKSISYNVAGALVVGYVVAASFFIIFKHTHQKYMEVLVSLGAVSIAYFISEWIKVSAPTAAVVVGIYFATNMSSLHEDNELYYTNFYIFWTVVDKILNGFLYILIGFASLYLHKINHFIVITIASICFALGARYLSILIPIHLFSRDREMSVQSYTGDKKKKERRALSYLLTWGGLKGGISIALALGTINIYTPLKYNYVVICTYAVVVFSTLAQGLSISRVYHRIENNLY